MSLASTLATLEDLRPDGRNPVKLFFVDFGTAATKGYMLVIATTNPTTTDFAKGAQLLKPGAGGSYVNTGTGYGASPTWTEMT